MSKIVIRLVSSVGKQQGILNIRTIYHIDQGTRLISISSFLENGVHIYVLDQIVHSVDVQQIICFLAVYTWEEGIWIIGIGCNL